MQNIIYSLYDVTGIFDFGKAFICIIMLPIIFKAEDVIKTIFGLESKNLAGAAAMGLVALSAAQKIGKFAKESSKKFEKAIAAKNVNRATDNVVEKNVPKNQQTTNVANNNMEASADNKNNNKKVGKKLLNTALGKGQIANKLASDAMGMALGYALTGDYDTARTGKVLQKGIRDVAKGTAGSAVLSRNIYQKNMDMLNAYDDLKDAGYTDEQIYNLTEEILENDSKQLATDLEKQYARTIQSVKDTQVAISDKEDAEAEKGAKKYVEELVKKHGRIK